MNLTSAAIEAAEQAVIQAMIDHGPDGHIDGYEQIARSALEAAAPHMCRELHTQRTEWPDIPRVTGARQA